ncbi:MAG: DUF397 domain-containing protein [Hamadaea sp.]|nr:DUF397 domain-containing protein [Hamadaea sp.]
MWRRSQRCDSNSCVEVAFLDDHVLVRDSKDPQGPVLRFTAEEWTAFAAGLQAGDFA